MVVIKPKHLQALRGSVPKNGPIDFASENHKTEKIKHNFTAQTNWNSLFEKKRKKKKYYAPELFVTSHGRFKKYRVNEGKENSSNICS